MAIHFQGQVKRIYVNRDVCHVRLEGHGDGYFKLPMSHANYNALYSMILSSAVERHPITLRTAADRPTQTNEHIDIIYAVLDW